MSNQMSLELADAIRMDWGKFLELTNGTLMGIFMSTIPQSFLPYPKETIKEAMGIIIKHCSDSGDSKTVELCQTTLAFLEFYVSDEEAIKKASKFFNDKNYLEAVLPRLAETQRKQFEYLQNKLN
ncbi:MAG: hypothetical protein WCV58_00785 [Patescibacteria group bacterium]